MKLPFSILINVSLLALTTAVVGSASNPKMPQDDASVSMRKIQPVANEVEQKEAARISNTPPEDTIPYPLKSTNYQYYNDPSTPQNNLNLNDSSIVKQEVTYDPETGLYILTETAGGYEVKPPIYLTQKEYMDWVSKKSEEDFWKDRANTDAVMEGKGLIPEMYIGGGLFNRLFGGSTVDIRPSGNLDLTVGYSWQNIQNLQLLEKQRKTSNPDFDMNINLNVVGKIGEKLKLNTAYNTQATFNFENQIKLDYSGDEDQIIQKLEAGNVSMPLRSQLIQGSQTLFGFKTQLKFGKLSVTGLLSQQQSKMENIQVQGGAQTKDFQLLADQYEENKHFFIGQYFRNGNPSTGQDGFEWALKNPPTLNSQFQINRIEVWVTNTRNVTENTREVVAFSDLGENKPYNTLLNPSGVALPDNKSNDLYSRLVAQGDAARDLGTSVSTLTSTIGLTAVQDFEKSRMYKLSEQEYTYDPKLGTISLNTQLKSAEILGVAYQYTYNGELHQVGEFSQDVPSDSSGSKILFLKMLKSSSVRTNLPIWDLMMKNIYSLGAYQVNKEDFRLDVVYMNPGGGDIRYLPEGSNVEGIPLISLLGLDKLNVQNDPQPDGIFDFYEYSIKTNNGRIMFPVLEPFGSDLREKFAASQPDLANKYAYDSLYRSTKARALQFPEKNRFKIKGTYKSSISSEISLGAFNIPKNSIKVTAGGQVLKENIDYTVDYNLGKVKILNDGILNSGVPINVGYEDPALIGFQVQRLLGARAEYTFNKNFYLGATYMQLTERPFTQKVNIGDDPINNRIVGLDGSFSTEAPFITRVLDKLPLYSTKEKSTINFNAEGAMFIPGHSKLINSGDKEGQVYLDDFEGAASEYDLKYPNTAWIPASTPYNAKNPLGQIMFPEANDIDSTSYNINRARTAWYTIDPIFINNTNQTPDPIKNNKAEQESPYVRQYQETDLFPNRQLSPGTQTSISTFDLSFFPKERGFYNYDYTRVNTDGTLQNPKSRWGGIMRGIEYNDFENANVQFIDFWMLDPFILRQDTGDLYINLGSVSEDVLKDSRQFFENALPPDQNPSKVDITNLGVVPKYPPITNNFDNNADSRVIQDLGYDGRNNDLEKSTWQVPFLDNLTALNTSAYAKVQKDPSSDDFHHYRGDDYDAQNVGVISRYKYYNGSEGNSPISSNSQDYINSSSQLPDIEDLNRDYTLNENEEYFQYRLHLEPNMKVGENFITDKVEFVRNHDGVDRDITFYHFRIPIQQYENRVGGIQDFRSIRFMRLFLTGFTDSVTCRFARMDLIRNQWRNYEFSLLNPGEYLPIDANDATTFNTGAVNYEENSSRTPIPYVLPPGVEREYTVGAANTNLQQNEQSLSMKLCNLKDGDARAIFKTVNLDLRQFKRLKLYVHEEELPGSDSPLHDDELTAFVRIGSDFISNYYEYEIPLKVTLANTTDPYSIWPSSNIFDISLDSLTATKLQRNSLNKPYYLPYTVPVGSGKNISVIGNPDLGRAAAIMIGIRNPKAENSVSDDGLPKCAEVWVNELKMQGFDEKGGYAAIARADIKLADLGTLNLSGSLHTQGFGALDQKLQDRYRDNLYTYDASAGLELGKFLPKKANIKIPAYVGISQSFSNPEYDPFDSDIKLKDKVDQVRVLQGETAADSVRRIAQTRKTIRSVNFTNVRKERAADAKTHIYDIENFNVSYSYNNTERNTPEIESDKMERHKASLGYNFSMKPKFIQPFNRLFDAKTKYFKWLKEFNFYPLPTSILIKTELNRDLGTTQLRKLTDDRYPVLPTYIKNLTWFRNYGLKFDLTKSIKLDYTATNQSRIDERPGSPSTSQILDTLAFTEQTEPWGRTTVFNQSANASYALPIDKLPYMDWVKIRASYGATYNWIGAARTSQALALKNTISNTRNIQLNGDFDIKKIWDYIPFIKEYNKSQFPAAKSKEKAGAKEEPKKGGKDAKDPAPEEDKAADSKDKKDKKKTPHTADPLLAFLIKPLISLKKISVNYTETGGTTLPGYMYRTKYFGMQTYVDQWAPGAAFAFGHQYTNTQNQWLDNISERGWITEDELLNNLYLQNRTNNLQIKALFEPYYDLKVDVNVTKNFTKDHNQLFKMKNGSFEHLNPSDKGTFSISYIGWKTLFEKPGKFYSSAAFTQFENNRAEIIQRLIAKNPYYNIDAANHYGIYQQDVVIPAFIAAYTGKSASTVQTDIFKILPKPNWRISYNGLSNIPAFKNIIQSINITHAYSSTLSVGSYYSNLNYKDTLDVANYSYDSLSGNFFPLYNIPMITMSEQLSPLLGIDIAFKKPRLTAKAEYKLSRNIGLSLIDYQLIESRTKDLTIGMGYKAKNVRLPFIKFKNKPVILKNDLNFKFDFSIRDNMTINRKLDQDFAEPTKGTFTYRIAPSIDYMVNQSLNVRLFFDKSFNKPKTSASAPISNTRAGLTIRFTLGQ